MSYYNTTLDSNWIPINGYFPSWVDFNKTLHTTVFPYFEPISFQPINALSPSASTTVSSSFLLNSPASSLHSNVFAKILEVVNSEFNTAYSNIQKVHREVFGEPTGLSFMWVAPQQTRPTSVAVKVGSGWVTIDSLEIFEASNTPKLSWCWEDGYLYLSGMGYVSGSVGALSANASGVPGSVWAGEDNVYLYHEGLNSIIRTGDGFDPLTGMLYLEGVETIFYKKSGYHQEYISLLIDGFYETTAERQKTWSYSDSNGLIHGVYRKEGETLRELYDRVNPFRQIAPIQNRNYFECCVASLLRKASTYSPLTSADASSFIVNAPKHLLLINEVIDGVTNLDYDSAFYEGFIGKRGYNEGDPLVFVGVVNTLDTDGKWLFHEDGVPKGVAYSGVTAINEEKTNTYYNWDNDDASPDTGYSYF